MRPRTTAPAAAQIDPIALLNKLQKKSKLRLRLSGATQTFCVFDPDGVAIGDMRTRNFTRAVENFYMFLMGSDAVIRAIRAAGDGAPHEPSAEQIAQAEHDLKARSRELELERDAEDAVSSAESEADL